MDTITDSMTRFRVVEGPSHEVETSPGPLQGFYWVEVVDDDGDHFVRYVTDKQRAAILDRIDSGQRELSSKELQELTVAPDIDALEARVDAEGGDGG